MKLQPEAHSGFKILNFTPWLKTALKLRGYKISPQKVKYYEPHRWLTALESDLTAELFF